MRRAVSASAARSLFRLLVVLPGLLWPRRATTEAFLVGHHQHHHHYHRYSQQQWRRPPPHDDDGTKLCAKKKAGSAAARNNNNSNNPNKAGFGAAPAAADNRQKLRSVSGRGVGAGSKPLRQAALAFDRLRKQYGVAACRDVYVRSPLNSPTTFWYVGKVAFCPDSSGGGTSSDGVSACLSQKRVILEYSRQQLRPQNMDGKYAAALELWLAPGDSEMDVVQNKVSLEPVRGSAADLPDDFTVETVGYNPEVYVGDEVTKGGLRVELSEEGQPVRPPFEVNQSA